MSEFAGRPMLDSSKRAFSGCAFAPAPCKTFPLSRTASSIRRSLWSIAVGLLATQALAAGPMTDGETVSGSLSGPGFSENWTFSGSAGDAVLLSAVSTGGSADTQILLFAPGSATPEAQSSCGLSCADYLPHVLLQSGTYTIEIRDAGLNDAGTYNLTLLKLPGALTSAGDPDGGPIASGETLSGSATAISDLDGYTFSGTANDVIVLSCVTTGGPIDTQILVFAPGSASPVAQSGCGLSCTDFLTYKLLQSGTYTIVILDAGQNQTGSYNLTLLQLPGTLTSAGDPDGGPILSGETRVGSATAISDLDAYTFPGSAGDVVAISCVATAPVTIDSQMMLFAPGSASPEAQSSCGLSCSDFFTRTLSVSGTYTIVILDAGQNNTGPYKLTLERFVEGVPVSSDEDGAVIRSGDRRTSWINQQSDLDYVRFYGDAGTRVLISAVSTPYPFDTQILLYPPGSSSPIAQSACGLSCSDFVEVQLTSSGIHRLLVLSAGLTLPGLYRLSFHSLPGGPSYPTDLDGGAIAPGQVISGSFNATSDFDMFHFYGAAGDQVTLTATATGGGVDTQLLLYPPTGGPLVAQSACGLSCSDVVQTTLGLTGLYSAVVMDAGMNQAGSYTLALAKSPADMRPGLYDPFPADKGSAPVPAAGVLSWDAVPGATTYDLYFGSDPLASLPAIASGLAANSFPMPALTHDTVYDWRVVAHTPSGDIQGPTWNFYATNGSVDVRPGPVLPSGVALERVEPNPGFGPQVIAYALPQDAEAELAVYDLRGALVNRLVTGTLPAGRHVVAWDGSGPGGLRSPAGIYFIRLRALGTVTGRTLVRLN